ncbi:cysteine proteinase [Rhizoclosmatium globosum]|uniref:Cysteine proteinase n=1 Tax=Rhizoclosmatium globosum TaxID=329046 RepID=A0A1Y2CPR1_9FUNG|nr:cysteine proteinase [Rhizoclosmatium globosum]|eukprot:ORY49011.1 cysteine proteinase [Rhizoclosmatium globosum]
MLASSSNQSSRLHAALNRIGFYSSKQTEHSEALPLPPATVETLFQIHRCLITSIPYENLSVYFPPAWYVPGQVVAADGLPEPPIRVDIDSVFNKLVEQKRGGFCLELNTLYSWILTTLGYSVTTHLCKMVMGITEQDPAAHDIAKHIILLVTVPGTLERYCCDIGLSDLTALNPLGFYQGAEAPINAGKKSPVGQRLLAWS